MNDKEVAAQIFCTALESKAIWPYGQSAREKAESLGELFRIIHYSVANATSDDEVFEEDYD